MLATFIFKLNLEAPRFWLSLREVRSLSHLCAWKMPGTRDHQNSCWDSPLKDPKSTFNQQPSQR